MTPQQPQSPPPLLEFGNVTVIRAGRTVLDSLSVTIHDGENIAVLGPNGSGKSTFVRTVTREYYPLLQKEPVTFRINGLDVWDVFALRSILGI